MDLKAHVANGILSNLKSFVPSGMSLYRASFEVLKISKLQFYQTLKFSRGARSKIARRRPLWRCADVADLGAAMPRHRRQSVSVDANRSREQCMIDPCVCVDCRTCVCVRRETGDNFRGSRKLQREKFLIHRANQVLVTVCRCSA